MKRRSSQKALEHYHAYSVAAKREDGTHQKLDERAEAQAARTGSLLEKEAEESLPSLFCLECPNREGTARP